MPFGLGTQEMLVIGVVALLLFGSRLPDVARSLGKSLTEFKKGMSGIEEDFRAASRGETTSHSTPTERPAAADQPTIPTAPKFEAPRV